MASYSASVKINATSNLKGVTKDIDKGLKKNNKSLKKNSDAWKKTTKAMKSFGKASLIATTAAAAGILALIKSTANFGDELAKTSEKTGLTVTELQRLRFAAQIGGASASDLTTGVRMFSRAIDEAAQGTMEYQEAFDRLGVSTTDQNGKIRKTVDIFGDIADVFEKAEDGASKTSLAQQLFGRGGSALIPILNEGSSAISGYGDELERIGFLITDDQAKASEQFNDDLLRLQTEIGALGRVIAVDAIPPLNDFINAFRQNLPAIRDWVTENIKLGEWLQKIADISAEIDLAKIFDITTDALSGTIDDIKHILDGMTDIVDFLSGEDLLQGTLGAAEAVNKLAGQALGVPVIGAQPATNPNDINLRVIVDQQGNVTAIEGDAPKNINIDSEIMLMIPAGLAE